MSIIETNNIKLVENTNNYDLINFYNKKIDEINNKYLLSLENYKKNYILYYKNTSSTEYEQIFFSSEMQLNSIIKEMKNLQINIHENIDKENNNFIEINEKLLIEKNNYFKLKNKRKLNDGLLKSKIMLDNAKENYKYINLYNIELIIGSIILLINIGFMFKK